MIAGTRVLRVGRTRGCFRKKCQREWVGAVGRIVTNKGGLSWPLPLRLQTPAETLDRRGVLDLRKGSELWEAPGCYRD